MNDIIFTVLCDLILVLGGYYLVFEAGKKRCVRSIQAQIDDIRQAISKGIKKGIKKGGKNGK